MSRPRFLADHDLNEHIIAGVQRREPSIEFIRLRDVGMSGESNGEVVEFSSTRGYLLVSHGVNTMPNVATQRMIEGKSFPGLLMIPQTAPIQLIIGDLLLIWIASEMEEWERQIVFLPFS